MKRFAVWMLVLMGCSSTKDDSKPPAASSTADAGGGGLPGLPSTTADEACHFEANVSGGSTAKIDSEDNAVARGCINEGTSFSFTGGINGLVVDIGRGVKVGDSGTYPTKSMVFRVTQGGGAFLKWQTEADGDCSVTITEVKPPVGTVFDKVPRGAGTMTCSKPLKAVSPNASPDVTIADVVFFNQLMPY